MNSQKEGIERYTEGGKLMEFTTYASLPITATAVNQTVDWGVSITQAPLLWHKTKGEGIKIAVLDTGIDHTHPDLAENIKGGVNFTTTNPDDWMDRQGHGTHCAGIIAGTDNGQGVVGVSPKADLYGVKVLADNGSGTIDWIIRGIDWCIANQMDIVSMSLGTSADPGPELQRAMQRARAAGIILIAASGNEATHCGWPAAYPEVIAVGAVDPTLEKAAYSNFGEEIDIVAGGSEILSTYLNKGYARLSGTSMATPIVTGAAALVQRYARLQDAKIGPVTIMDLLRSRSVGLGGTRLRNDHFGSGLVNVYKLIENFNENR